MTEIFFVLEGEATFAFDDETVQARTGMTVTVPPDARPARAGRRDPTPVVSPKLAFYSCRSGSGGDGVLPINRDTPTEASR